MASAAEALVTNTFDTVRSPEYQGYRSCYSFQQGPVSTHNRMPSLCSLSTGISTHWHLRKTQSRFDPKEFYVRAVRDLYEPWPA